MLLIRPHVRLRVSLIVWGILAAVSVVVAVHSGSTPGRAEAYSDVRRWLAMWLSGTDVYASRYLAVDYPPNALVVLAPMAALPAHYGEMLFAIFNAAACALVAWALVSVVSRLTDMQLTRRERLAYVLLLLATAPTRVSIWNGQTSPFVLSLCVLGMRFWDASPVLGGVLLGLGVAKPHVALPFYVLATYARRWTTIAVSMATALLLAYAYCVVAGRPPLDVLVEYWQRLQDIYSGPYFIRGEVDLRPMFVDLFHRYAFGESLFLLSSVGIGAALLWLVWRVRDVPGCELPVLCASLMACMAVFPFRRYGLFMLVPTLLWSVWRPHATDRERWIVILVTASMVVDVPFLLRHAIDEFIPTWIRYRQHTDYVNRFVTVGFLAATFSALYRSAGRRPASL